MNISPDTSHQAPLVRVDAKHARYVVKDLDGIMDVSTGIADAVDALITEHAVFAPGETRNAYVSFVTPDYRWGLLVWLRSLRKVSQKPVILLVPRRIDLPGDLTAVYQLQVPSLHDDQYNLHRAEFVNVYTKLWIFALTPLTRVVFIDIDCVILKNVDHLFDHGEFFVCPDYVETRDSRRFNSGVLVFNPTPDLRDHVFATMQCVQSYDDGDQGALNHVLADKVTYLDETYNLLRHFYYFSGRRDLSDVHILHYIVKKPWELRYRETPDAFLVPLDDVWTSFLTREELLGLVAEWRRSVFWISERQRIESVRAAQLARAAPANARSSLLDSVRRRWRGWRDQPAAVPVLAGVAAVLVLIALRKFG